MPNAIANGIRLHYEESGDGDPLLLISGLAGGRAMWQPVLPSFIDDYRTISYDPRGIGDSDKPPGPYTIDQMADDAAGLLRQTGHAPAYCVGLSMGGCVLQALAYRHPDVVRKAVLVSTFASYTKVQEAWLTAGLALRRAGVDPFVQAIAGMPWVYTGRVMSIHAKAQRWAELATGDGSGAPLLASFEAHAEATRTFDSRAYLDKITVPTLVLIGAEDILTPVHQSAEMAGLIPNAQLSVLPRGSHNMVVEYQDDVAREIRAFCRDG